MLNQNLDIRIQILEIILLPNKMAQIPEPLEFDFIILFLKNNGLRCNDQNYRDKTFVIIRKSLYRLRSVYDRILKILFKEKQQKEIDFKNLVK